jgi:hypothetical protein
VIKFARGRESKNNFYFVWFQLQIKTKMRKGKYASKIKNCDHLGREGQLSFSFP